MKCIYLCILVAITFTSIAQPTRLKTDDPSGTITPQPASDKATLEITVVADEETSVNICNLSGRTLKEIPTHLSVGKNKVVLDVSQLPDGIYTVTMHTSSGTGTQKLVVRH